MSDGLHVREWWSMGNGSRISIRVEIMARLVAGRLATGQVYNLRPWQMAEWAADMADALMAEAAKRDAVDQKEINDE